MILIIIAGVITVLLMLAEACGGCLGAESVPALPTAQGRHARHWPPHAAMADTRELAALYGREYPENRR